MRMTMNCSINLNPDYVDNNVFLLGVLEGTKMNGRWMYTGFPGVVNEGTFKALRK